MGFRLLSSWLDSRLYMYSLGRRGLRVSNSPVSSWCGTDFPDMSASHCLATSEREWRQWAPSSLVVVLCCHFQIIQPQLTAGCSLPPLSCRSCQAVWSWHVRKISATSWGDWRIGNTKTLPTKGMHITLNPIRIWRLLCWTVECSQARSPHSASMTASSGSTLQPVPPDYFRTSVTAHVRTIDLVI